jgi:hypothetical protein
MSRRKKSSLPQPVQEQLNRIVAPVVPRVMIILDDRNLDIITRYRQAKEAMRQAIDQSIANQGSDLIWTDADREAVELADKALRHCQIAMCALLDIAAFSAGV